MKIPANQLMFIRRVLYTLKRDFGGPLDLYKLISSETDPRTGKKTIERRRIEVRKAVILPSVLARKFSYDLSYIAANKNFVYGANYDVNASTIIIDAKDIPKGVEITTSDWAVIGTRRCEIRLVDKLEYDYGYLLSVKETLGSLPWQSLSIRVGNTLRMENTAGATV